MCFKAFGVLATEHDQYRGHAIILTSLHPRRGGCVQLLDRILLSPQCASLQVILTKASHKCVLWASCNAILLFATQKI